MPRRVKVTSPRRTARRVGHRSRYLDVDEETALGEVYVDSILRAQRRLALSLLGCVAVLVLCLPAVLVVIPDMPTVGVVTLPASWLGLGVVVYPLALLVTYWYVRAAERVEREFAELMELP